VCSLAGDPPPSPSSSLFSGSFVFPFQLLAVLPGTAHSTYGFALGVELGAGVVFSTLWDGGLLGSSRPGAIKTMPSKTTNAIRAMPVQIPSLSVGRNGIRLGPCFGGGAG
jgi:hypothetical protein